MTAARGWNAEQPRKQLHPGAAPVSPPASCTAGLKAAGSDVEPIRGRRGRLVGGFVLLFMRKEAKSSCRPDRRLSRTV